MPNFFESHLHIFRSLKKAAIVLLMMNWLAHPTGETELSDLLDISPITAHTYLSSLEKLGLVRRSRVRLGYCLTHEGTELLADITVPFEDNPN